MNQPIFRSLPLLRSMPLIPKRAPRPKDNLRYEIAEDPKTILEIQRFRARVFGEAYNREFEQGIDHDDYDQYSYHVLVRDTHSNKIVACTRIITPEAKAKLGKYCSEFEFNLDEYLAGKEKVYEIGRTCVDESYRGGKTLAVLWMGMVPLVLNRLQAKFLIGTVSVNLSISNKKLVAAKGYILKKAKYKDFKSLTPFDMEEMLADSYETFVDVTTNNPKKMIKYRKKDVPSLIKQYRRIGATFSEEGCFDPDFNCVDYFVAIKVNKRLIFKLNMVCKLMELKKKK